MKDKYDVDLLTFRKDGLFYDKIPQEVNVIKETEPVVRRQVVSEKTAQ